MLEASLSTRPATPPPRGVPNTNLELTPEHVKCVELNRLKAKARQREKEMAASTASSSTVNTNNKRPLGVTPATSRSPTGASKEAAKLNRDSRLGKYFDYDLSKMVNTKGGFLVEEGEESFDKLREKERQRERERAMQNIEPPVFLDPRMNPKCAECGSTDIDQTYKKVFRCLVCKKCKEEKVEKYSLLTKTECKEDYLLTDSELRDEEVMPHLLKANPHKSTFANMMLFCRFQVEDFAWKKWGSAEALDAEWERRTTDKNKRKNTKFEQGLRELRKRTREGVWQKRQDETHKHMFTAEPRATAFSREAMSDDPVAAVPDEQEVLQIEAALEVEQLDTFLFRSKKLNVPYLARGAFGGQVISQALVSATQCVPSKYLLHCYFLFSVSPAIPVLYYVTNIRDGKSYCTRVVRAVQYGHTVFYMVCSFHVPEPGQPMQQWPMPLVVPPEEAQREEDFILSLAQRPGISESSKEFYRNHAKVAYKTNVSQQRALSPVDVRLPGNQTNDDGKTVFVYWMKTREKHSWASPFQKVRAHFVARISAASTSLGLRRTGKGSNRLTMTSSLDHAIAYYDHDFDCSEWMLYVIDSPAAGSGRGYMFSRGGKLLAVLSQEGVIRGPQLAADAQAKL
ncbi:hypothetical protein K488DRAFT_76953 [Vararia minispora EC-137]|uniref:Uncharacterized protein n=1 Tax=Vararia minispora EC-137 TaxID=1314806 RepID=A0ACB8QSS5_9AGAM|nr:hypothetical protein K488DRAFT_76953 [Vararia minispora EC-137]